MKGVTAKIVRSLRFRQAVAVMVLLLVAAGPFTYLRATAAQMSVRSVKISNADPSGTADYAFSFDIVTPGILGSIRLQFCSNDPFPGMPCTPPAGLDALTNVTLSSQFGTAGFSIDPSSTTNDILLSRTPQVSVPVSAGYTLSGITNPDTPGSYYVRLQTFAAQDGSGAATNYGGLAYVINSNQFSLNAEVPPFLLFCSGLIINDDYCNSVTGDYINFGNFTPAATKTAQSELLVATNGEFGYAISMHGNTMTSGNNVITALANNDVSRPGLSQFGINLRANSTPTGGRDPAGPGTGQPTPNYNMPDRYRFNDADVIASNINPEDTRKYTVSYIVNISAAQPVGVYVTTLSYICLANF